jgi:hypothetical protein
MDDVMSRLNRVRDRIIGLLGTDKTRVRSDFTLYVDPDTEEVTPVGHVYPIIDGQEYHIEIAENKEPAGEPWQ